jgi:hypothetical protein
MPKNPFTYGNPITDPARFIGRRREVAQVHSRLSNAEFESSSVVGERRIGKTSLLKYLSHPHVTAAAGFPADAYIFSYIDLQILDPTKTPTDFWRRTLRAIRRQVGNNELRSWIDEICREPAIDAFILDDVFGLVDDLNLHIVLLLDEFERVTQNASFDLDFFSGLRSIAIHHNLALITSSRRELVELTHSRAVQDSPFFNIFANINVRPFSDQESRNLIASYMSGNDLQFHPGDIDYVLWTAGPHPYFLQMACSLLYDAYQDHPSEHETQARRHHLEREFRDEAAPMFSDYWHHSSREQRTMLAILSRRHRKHEETGQTLQELQDIYTGAESMLVALEKRGLVLMQDNVDRTRPAENVQPAETRYKLLSPALGAWINGEISKPPEDSSTDALISRRRTDAFAQLVTLRRILVQQFDINDLRTLCFDMNIDYEGLPGDGKGAKVRELLAFLERRGRIYELLDTIRQLRPDLDLDRRLQQRLDSETSSLI